MSNSYNYDRGAYLDAPVRPDLSNISNDRFSKMRGFLSLESIPPHSLKATICNRFFANVIQPQELATIVSILTGGKPGNLTDGSDSMYKRKAIVFSAILQNRIPGVTLAHLHVLLSAYEEDGSLDSVDLSALPESAQHIAIILIAARNQLDSSEIMAFCFDNGIDYEEIGDIEKGTFLPKLVAFLQKDNILHLLESRLDLSRVTTTATNFGTASTTVTSTTVSPSESAPNTASESEPREKKKKRLLAGANSTELLTELGITATIHVETRPLAEIMKHASQTNRITFSEVRHIADELNLNVAHLKLAAHLFLKSIGYVDKAAAYTELVSSDAREYMRNQLLQVFSEKSARYGQVAHFLEALIKSKRLLELIKDGAPNTDPEAKTAITICEFCGTNFSLPTLDNKIQYPAICPCCATPGSIVEVKTDSSNMIISNIRPDDPEIEALSRLRLGALEFRGPAMALLKRLTVLELRLWFDRMFLMNQNDTIIEAQVKQNLTPEKAETLRVRYKKPSEAVLPNKGKSDLARDAILHAESTGITTTQFVSSLFPKPNNFIPRELLVGDDVITCYCADCNDVWLQPIQNTTLQQVTDSDLYSPQGFKIPDVHCGNCNSNDVHESADFSHSLHDELAKLPNDTTALRNYFEAHFGTDDFQSFVAYFTGRAGAIEDLRGSRTTDKMRELISHSMRHGTVPKLLGQVYAFRFENSRGGRALAVQCAHCNTVVSTTINLDGMVMLTFCPTCAQVDQWKTFRPTTTNPLPDKMETMYHAFVQNHLDAGAEGKAVTPTLIHISQMPSE